MARYKTLSPNVLPFVPDTMPKDMGSVRILLPGWGRACNLRPMNAASPARDILIEELNGALWVAAIENGRFAAIDLDPQIEDVRWGSLYWAKVTRVDTRLNAAFLDLDGEATGLIQAADVWLESKKGWLRNPAEKIGKVLKPGQMIVVQVKDARLSTDPLNEDDLPMEKKASKASMDISLMGRYLIHTPLSPQNRISQRIRDVKLREQLSAMMKSLHDLSGCILRASAAGCQTDVLVREGKILQKLWEDLQDFERDDEPGLIWAGPDAIHRVLADQAGSQIRVIEVSTMENFGRVEEWATDFAPDLVTRIQAADPPENVAKMKRKQQHYEDLGLFDWHDLVDQLNGLFADYVVLESGGGLIIQDTALGTMIDVNLGGARSSVQVNSEAMREIARHIRLRNIGGAILIDPAGNLKPQDKKALEKLFVQETANDPSTVICHGFTRLGLLEVTRARRAPSLADRIKALQ